MLLGRGRWVVSIRINVTSSTVGGGAWPGVWWVSMKRHESDLNNGNLSPEAGQETGNLRWTDPSKNGFEARFRDFKGLDACVL